MQLDLMRLIDNPFLEPPVYGVRQMSWLLRNEGHLVNGKRIRRLMRLMGLMPVHQKPNYEQGSQRAQDLPLPAAPPSFGTAQ